MRIVLAWIIVCIPTMASAGLGGDAQDFVFQEGDIVFQESRSRQSAAIRDATGSRYTHVGVVVMKRDVPYVLEAVQPVRLIPFKRWKTRGVDAHVVVKRLKQDEILKAPTIRRRMKAVGRAHLGKKYDLLFAWDLSRIYCSELVYRVFLDGAGIHLGEVERFGDMDLSSPRVRALIKRRMGQRLDLHEPIITPVSIMEDRQLETVAEF